MPDAPEHIVEHAPAPLPPPVIRCPMARRLPTGRPVAPAKKPRRKRRHVIGVRLDDAELAQLETRAREAGLTVGAYIRACALGERRAARPQAAAG